jgi:excisionase family DNA binding protein
MATTQNEILERLGRIETLLAGNQPQPLSFPEACKYLHFAPSTLYRLTSKSLIGHFKTGKLLFFLREDLDKFLLAHRISVRKEI